MTYNIQENGLQIGVGSLMHPSPINPAANKGNNFKIKLYFFNSIESQLILLFIPLGVVKMGNLSEPSKKFKKQMVWIYIGI